MKTKTKTRARAKPRERTFRSIGEITRYHFPVSTAPRGSLIIIPRPSVGP